MLVEVQKAFPQKQYNIHHFTMVYKERRTFKQCFIVSLDSLENSDTFYVPGAKHPAAQGGLPTTEFDVFWQ